MLSKWDALKNKRFCGQILFIKYFFDSCKALGSLKKVWKITQWGNQFRVSQANMNMEPSSNTSFHQNYSVDSSLS